MVAAVVRSIRVVIHLKQVQMNHYADNVLLPFINLDVIELFQNNKYKFVLNILSSTSTYELETRSTIRSR